MTPRRRLPRLEDGRQSCVPCSAGRNILPHSPTLAVAWSLVHAEDEWKKTLALDLDGTLKHTSFEQRIDMGGEEYIARVFCRQNLDRFLEDASSRYKLVVFTAASQEYADPIIDRIDTNNKNKAGLSLYPPYSNPCPLTDTLLHNDLTIDACNK
jgi:hypothetical protein